MDICHLKSQELKQIKPNNRKGDTIESWVYTRTWISVTQEEELKSMNWIKTLGTVVRMEGSDYWIIIRPDLASSPV